MASGNTTKIDEVVDPVAVEQFNALKTAGKELRTELSQLLQSAINLNAVLGGSTPASFAKNLQASTDATNKIIANNNKQIENEQKKAAKQEEIINKYLVLLSKQEAARQQSEAKQSQRDAKEIAAAEAKQAKLDAIATRKANVQFPTSSTAPNPITDEPSDPSTRYEPIIIGNENMVISATKSAEAIAGENAALLEQQEVLSALSIAQRANLESLLQLQVERAANDAELKKLTIDSTSSAERAAFLTAEQLRLKVAISEVTVELNKQTKEQLAQNGSVKELTAALEILRNEYFELGAAERESASGQAMLVNINKLDTEVKRLRMSVGDTSKEVGAYEKAIAKATSGTALATQAITVATRTIVRMFVQFALFGIIFKAAEALYDYIRALDIFNPIATEAQMRQQSLVDAFNSADYQKGIESLEKLGANLELIKEGIGSSDNVINEYNATIGKTFGYVNNLTDAQKGFIDNSDAYIKAIYLEAAAQSILADSAKEIGTAMAKNQEDRNEIEKLNAGGGTVLGINLPNKKLNANDKLYVKGAVDNLQASINARDKRIKEIIENSKKALQNTYKDLDAVPGQGGTTPGSDPTAELSNKIANESLEREKIIAQAKINNEKLSYKTRLDAINEFYNASEQIEKNNEALQLKELPAKDVRREDAEKEATNKLLTLQLSRNTQLAALRDKQYKQDQEILKNNLQTQVDLFKSIANNPKQSFDIKLIALDEYNKKSQELIKANYDEQVKEAGKNAESIKLAEQERDKLLLQLANQTADDKLKIHKESLQKIIELSKESEQEQLDVLNEGASIAAQTLQDNRDKLLNIKNEEYAKGKIEERKYHRDILAINDEYNIQRLNQELTVQSALLGLQEGRRDSSLILAKNRNATPEELAKITSDFNKPISATKGRIASINGQLNNAISKQKEDQATGNVDDKKDKQKDLQDALGYAKDVTQDIQDLIDKGYENQISKLEKIGQKIQENADIEKAAIDRLLDTQSNKARREEVLAAETASKQKALQEEIAKEKRKQAVADKAAAIASIILNTAVAASKVLGQTGIFGIALEPVVLALGAIQLAAAVATPIPQFAKGTPTGGHKGGLAVIGEAGPERITEPGKPTYYSPGVATMVSLPRGTIVEPYKMLPETPKWTSTRSDNSAVVDGLNRVERAVSGQKQGRARVQGWLSEQRQADAWNGYVGRRFK